VVQVLKNADFLFESLFDSPLPRLVWTGGNETRKVDCAAPLFPISPSRAFAAILKGTSTNIDSDRKGGRFFRLLQLTEQFVVVCTSNSPHLIFVFLELEALVAKGKRLFSYHGVDISDYERRQFES